LSTVDSYFDWVIMFNTCLIASGPTAEVFNSEMIMRTYGRSSALLDQAAKLTQSKTSGLK
jgi:manganese/zinc/iron transport system ATP- binding protein